MPRVRRLRSRNALLDPRFTLALLISSVTLYALACILAFRLYDPARYFDFGMPATAVALVVETLGRLHMRLRRKAIKVKTEAVEIASCEGSSDGSIQKTDQAMSAISVNGRTRVRA